MARRRVDKTLHYARAIANELSEWAAPKGKKKRKAGIWNRVVVRVELEEMIRTDNFVVAQPKHFVELYARMHEKVYGVEDLETQVVRKAMIAAATCKRALVKYFANDPRQMAEYMRWVWTVQHQEQKRKKARTDDTSAGFRVTWKYQWAEGLITQYRRAQLTNQVVRP